ncbi:MAG: hypothetical protein MJ223_04270 [Mycoplasmoidaceae bacterium]|nr:hypothetical protein [Mycoplasmoidaceae bacterium]
MSIFNKNKNAAASIREHKGKYAIEMRNVIKTFAGGKIIANSNANISVK